MAQIMVVSRKCPGCKMLSHWPAAKFQQLAQATKKEQKADLAGAVLCDACNLISGYSSTIGLAHVYETDNPPSGALYENLFAIPLRCAGENCGTPAIVLAPKMGHYKDATALGTEVAWWRVADDVRCPSGHPIPNPASRLP